MQNLILHIYKDETFAKALEVTFQGLDFLMQMTNSYDEGMRIIKKRKPELALIVVSNDEYTSSQVNFFREIKKVDLTNIQMIAVVDTKNKIAVTNFMKLGFSNYLSIHSTQDEIKDNLLDTIKISRKAIQILENLRVVVVDDDNLQHIIVKELCTRSGIKNLTSFISGEALLENPPEADLYIVDIIMDKISGISVVQKLRAIFPKSVIIVVSSMSESAIISNAIENGADDFIIKPFERDIFIKKIVSRFR